MCSGVRCWFPGRPRGARRAFLWAEVESERIVSARYSFILVSGNSAEASGLCSWSQHRGSVDENSSFLDNVDGATERTKYVKKEKK